MSRPSSRTATPRARAPRALKGIVDRRKVTKIFSPPARGKLTPLQVRRAVQAVMAEQRAKAASEEA